MNRWNSMGATAPLWGTGLVLVLVGAVLILVARKEMRRGSR